MVGCGDPDTKRFGKTPRDRQPQPATAMPVAASALGKGIEDRPLGAWLDPLAAIAHGQCHAVGRPPPGDGDRPRIAARSEEHTSELQSLMRISYAVFCLKKKK